MSSVALRRASLPDGSLIDVHISGGTVTAVTSPGEITAGGPEIDLSGYLLTGSLVEPHAHLDKVFTFDRVANPAGTLAGAIEGFAQVVGDFTTADIRSRANRALRVLAANGTTAVRTHVGCGRLLGLRGVEALAAVREEWAGIVDLQIVAQIGSPEPEVWSKHVAILHSAVAAGANVIGGAPSVESEPREALDACFAVAVDLGLPVDFHIDETTDPAASDLERLVELAEQVDIPVVASHCVSLGAMDAGRAAELASRAAAARVAVVTLPATNLYLQGRDSVHPQVRGLTALNRLEEAGVLVAAGGDNVCDPFNPAGRLDPLETAALMLTAGHRTVAAAHAMVTTAPREALGLPAAGPVVGQRADLLAVAASSLAESIALAPSQRMVFRAGELISATRVEARGPVHDSSRR